MKHVYWVFGVIAGLLSVAIEYVHFSNISNLETFRLYWMAKLFVLAMCVVFGIIAMKKTSGGAISIARTLFTGGLISFIRAIVLILAFAIMYYPDGAFFDSAVELSYEQLDKMVEAGEMESKDLDMRKSKLASQFTVRGYAISTLFGSLITGLVISVLMAAFVSTNKMYVEE